MRQDKVYTLDADDGTRYFAIINQLENGLQVAIFTDEPSKDTEIDEAKVVVLLEAESSPDATRLLVKLWDDETPPDEDSNHIITLIQQEKEQDV